MLGSSDDDSGEEEVIGGSAEVFAPPPSVDPAPLASCPDGWTRHRSARYRNATAPDGYEYFHCLATGEVRWAVPPPPGPADAQRGVKRGLATPSAAPALYYASPPADYLRSQAELNRLVGLSDGHIKVAPGASGATEVRYYCDQQKREKWAFFTDGFGLELLCHLVRCNGPALAVCQELIQAADLKAGVPADRQAAALGEPSATLAEGKNIYTEKKHLIQGVEGHKKVTWSQEEYAHHGMQFMYLSLKSWQRFTETWALLERAGRLGLMEPHRKGGRFHMRPVRVLSIGGGPGYELLAMERYFRRYACAAAPVQLVSLDLMPGWRPFVQAAGMQFGEYDIEGSAALLDVAAQLNAHDEKPAFPPGGVTYVLISYVMIYVSTDAVCDMLAQLLASGGAYCILVSERGEVTKALGMMERRGVQVHRLIDQSNGLDERQSVWLHGTTQLTPPPHPIPVTFPNVPFEEGKARKNRRL